jgi:hypothetical protein
MPITSSVKAVPQYNPQPQAARVPALVMLVPDPQAVREAEAASAAALRLHFERLRQIDPERAKEVEAWFDPRLTGLDRCPCSARHRRRSRYPKPIDPKQRIRERQLAELRTVLAPFGVRPENVMRGIRGGLKVYLEDLPPARRAAAIRVIDRILGRPFMSTERVRRCMLLIRRKRVRRPAHVPRSRARRRYQCGRAHAARAPDGADGDGDPSVPLTCSPAQARVVLQQSARHGRPRAVPPRQHPRRLGSPVLEVERMLDALGQPWPWDTGLSRLLDAALRAEEAGR